MHVSAQMQVEIESNELQQTAEAVAANPVAMLGLEPQHGVGTGESGLGPQLTEQPLEADEGEHLRSSSWWNHPCSSAALYMHFSLYQYLSSLTFQARFVIEYVCVHEREGEGLTCVWNHRKRTFQHTLLCITCFYPSVCRA